ncbi:putative serine/threonine protein kinase [Schizophyllum amplum]|uniref:Putative serine/threonine protein kinase n=1 Tax=Schizophyllum amplum TaxID=97359 RepID=A0A550CU85_9AGAR|nr:putative serine/threonine protein kinase [Auriculariopsis ampla]
MSSPPKTANKRSDLPSAPSPSSTAQQSSSAGPSASKGQIHVKLIQARGLNVSSSAARPYVVVTYEQSEFVSRDPTDETDKEVRGVPRTTNGASTPVYPPPASSSSTALAALGKVSAAMDKAASGFKSTNTSPASSVSSDKSLFGRVSAHNPVWKHEVSFDVTSSKSHITFSVYDRAQQDQGFLGMLQITPALVHEHTVDQWYKLRPCENETVTGEMRVQITYEMYKTKRPLTPRDFEFLKLIGRGTFGKVLQVRKKDTKRIYAMKILSKREIVQKKEVAHTIGERKILQRSLESPFLVGLKFSFQTETDLYLVTDFKSGGELFWHLQRETRFSEERARFYIAELVLALEHLHKYNIVYRDLKPENILLDATGHVALCDFGLSKADLRPDELTTTFCGTTEYLAPEILLDEHGYSKIVDFWSLGVLLFEMCCGWSPFYAEDTQQMYKNICFGKIRFPRGVIGEEGKSFVKGLLTRNPKNRLGATRDADELKEHPFFKSIDWNLLALKQITPPFKPLIDSDESTANFDTEFTNADISEIIGDDTESEIDEDDPSEAWVSQSLSESGGHMPLGPLGQERTDPKSPALSRSASGRGTPPPEKAEKTEKGSGSSGKGGGIEIKQKKQRKAATQESPLTSSVQEKFKGFTYSGEGSVLNGSAMAGRRGAESGGEEEGPEPTTEDEIDDTGKSAGRYSKTRRRKGLEFTGLDD